jgi:hypothetical protein
MTVVPLLSLPRVTNLLPKNYLQKPRIATQSSRSQAVLGEGCLPGALRNPQSALDFLREKFIGEALPLAKTGVLARMRP